MEIRNCTSVFLFHISCKQSASNRQRFFKFLYRTFSCSLFFFDKFSSFNIRLSKLSVPHSAVFCCTFCIAGNLLSRSRLQSGSREVCVVQISISVFYCNCISGFQGYVCRTLRFKWSKYHSNAFLGNHRSNGLSVAFTN